MKLISISLILLFCAKTWAGLPPTSVKAAGDSSFLTTFQFEFPGIAATHTGTKTTFGMVSPQYGGTGVNGASASNGSLLIGNGSGYSLSTLTGTANQVSVANGAGSITLSTPQNIHTGASPTFTGLTLSGLSDGFVTSTSGVLGIEAIDANQVVFAPTGSISATDVQAAIAEVASEATLQAAYNNSASGLLTLNNTIGGIQINEGTLSGGTTAEIFNVRSGSDDILKATGQNVFIHYDLVFSEGGIVFPEATVSDIPFLNSAEGKVQWFDDIDDLLVYSEAAWKPLNAGYYGSDLTLTASDTLAINLYKVNQTWLVQGNSAAISLSTTPFTGTPQDLTEVTLIGNHDTNTVTITYNDASGGCVGDFTTITLSKYQTAKFRYVSAISRWVYVQ